MDTVYTALVFPLLLLIGQTAVALIGTGGYGVWKPVDYAAATTDIWPQVPPSATTYPSDKKIVCYALYTRNS